MFEKYVDNNCLRKIYFFYGEVFTEIRFMVFEIVDSIHAIPIITVFNSTVFWHSYIITIHNYKQIEHFTIDAYGGFYDNNDAFGIAYCTANYNCLSNFIDRVYHETQPTRKQIPTIFMTLINTYVSKQTDNDTKKVLNKSYL